MTYPYEVFLHDISLGCGSIDDVNWKEDLVQPEFLAFICPHCGDLWSRCIPHGARSRWHALLGVCDRCGVGSLWLNWMPDHCAALPTEVLEREFLIQWAEADSWTEYPGGFQAGIQPELLGVDF